MKNLKFKVGDIVKFNFKHNNWYKGDWEVFAWYFKEDGSQLLNVINIKTQEKQRGWHHSYFIRIDSSQESYHPHTNIFK